MKESFKPFAGDTLFLVWGPPSHGPRSKVFSRELGIEKIRFVCSTRRRGALVAPYKYSYQAVQTMRLLFRERPKIVMVQSPPNLAVLFVYIYCLLTGSRFVVDAHSAAFLHRFWSRPRFLNRFLARQAVATIVTNEHFARQLESWGGRALVLRDIPTTFPDGGAYPGLNGSFNVVVVSTFTGDEPLAEVLDAASDLPGTHFYVTGRKSQADTRLLARAPENVHFTDFLPDDAYYGLMRSGDAIMCLTTRNHTMQRGACEALSLGKPIITSDWPLLRGYFNKGTVYVSNDSAGIRDGVLSMQASYPDYEAGIDDLRDEQAREWQRQSAELVRLLSKS
jgi:glycosyltransferase involved in cell wall biosynthesis